MFNNNHNFQLLVAVSFLFISASCNAMETNHVTEPSILAKLTTDPDRRYEAFLTNDNIFIRSLEQYCIADIRTQNIIKT